MATVVTSNTSLSPNQNPSAKPPGKTSGKAPIAPSQIWLVNAAFLQEIKDSNPHLWHEFHHLRTLSQLEPIDCETPQQTIKKFAQCLDGLRDLVSLQFTLEESYGLISTPVQPSPYGEPTPEQVSLQEVVDERQIMTGQVIDQHRCLFLKLVDLVEQAEELQYRGCDSGCLKAFADKVERFACDFTAHERLEGELIRLHGSHSAIPASGDAEGDSTDVR